MKEFSKVKKEMLFQLASSIVEKVHIQGVQNTPVKISCDVLILDDKMVMNFPLGTEYVFSFGIFILYDMLNYPNMLKTILSFGGIVNSVIPCLTSRCQRIAYVHARHQKLLFLIW